MRLKRLASAFVLLALVAAGAGLGGQWYLTRWLATPGPLAVPTVLILPHGAGLGAIAQKLASARVIDHAILFRLGARLADRQGSLKAGEYAFEPGTTPAGVIERLARGDVLLHRITVPEGLTVKEVYRVLKGADALAGGLPPLPPEGSLLPETHLVPRGTPRARLVHAMERDLHSVLATAWAARAPDLPLTTPESALTLASIIEKETARSEEYGLVASVFLNRLKRGMRLQTDPSVIYALTRGDGPLGRPLTGADLALHSPWNTYEVEGLPPSPIANPGKAAIMAAVQPADTNYLYFVADGSGGHAFAATLAEHNRNVARWRKFMKEQRAGG